MGPPIDVLEMEAHSAMAPGRMLTDVDQSINSTHLPQGENARRMGENCRWSSSLACSEIWGRSCN